MQWILSIVFLMALVTMMVALVCHMTLMSQANPNKHKLAVFRRIALASALVGLVVAAWRLILS